jgi:hypothetical protein
MTIIALPNRLGMKKSAAFFIFFADHTPIAAMPSMYNPNTTISASFNPNIQSALMIRLLGIG